MQIEVHTIDYDRLNTKKFQDALEYMTDGMREHGRVLHSVIPNMYEGSTDSYTVIFEVLPESAEDREGLS